ncbi:hypothetical protein SMACR_07029 [Sordaria macrospora]|uniref:WGS project CABT00000000 data, contig 2.36 n=2 Tax=Sordaria macrospora TaxID=5147 RepID=F7W6W1_SORMK|nr:uncharacterized protein SMAC_07029 [Sordaria macrospora k-hell]KAA8634157.1 hypothetical protein SMACR_07029 [Sordaria macrospora]KAH7633616.1 hypothetical protein B0T09DRAFT_95052 [Sordaria sp. MPI-SDFR-AT-0083]WPJ60000.1 hypothetical protein SMAC4_07029 [Sordaria macrospora]CCC13251.1 unnamed protein product [Sordaria macrospora k-hell]
MATPNNMWSAPSPHPHHHQAVPPMDGDDLAMQVRPMGLKVLYTFDRDGQVSCLARWPHILQIQTLPVDERTTIGVVDLRTCLQAIAQCSPEIVNQQENDYTVYAVDYSEPDTPLVGQGMLSWGLEFASDHNSQRHQQQQLVTGRVTRSLLPVFSNGSRETLEVKMKLTAVAKMQRLGFSGMDNTLSNMLRSDPIQPTDITTSEWASFIQSNPGLGSSANMASMHSPAMSTAPLNVNLNGDGRYNMDIRSDPPPPPTRPASILPSGSQPQNTGPVVNNMQNMQPLQPVPPRPAPTGESASSPAPSQSVEIPANQSARPTSRPSSRASRTRVPTGRPRGRPRKKPLEAGNTSGVEEATDGDDGPQKKRAKVISADFTSTAPFGSAPESLRVAASTSGSLRNMRPVGAGGNPSLGNHVQDVPRAPTPVPDGSMLQRQQRRLIFENKMKSDFAGDAESSMYQSRFGQQTMQRSMSHDARSPTDSIGQSPDQGYVPEDSPADIGSSPPVPRTSAYMHSSPYVSSPVLPPMPVPMPQVDSGFMSGGFDDIFDEDELLQDAPQDHGQELPGQPQDRMVVSPPVPQVSKPNARKGNRAHRQGINFPFQEVNPGPKELLPTKSIFNPAGKTKALNRVAQATSVPPMPKKNADRPFKRSNTAPNPIMSDHDPLLQQPNDQQDGETHQEGTASQNSQAVMQGSQTQHQPPFNLQQQSSTQSTGNTSAQPPATIPVTTVMPIPERPEPVHSKAAQPATKPVSNNSASAAPASDPVVESTGMSSRAAQSEAPAPAPARARPPPPREPSEPEEPPRYNKNMVKKQSIKEKLEEAIQRGESPPFCNNCGAIETPTWRKIWTQDHRGVPGVYEFSDKPGFVTTIDILEKDADGQSIMYQLVKKNLGPRDDKKLWKETLLCNPCGIWLAKFKVHRPQDRWDKDAARLNQPRKKKNSRNKKRKNDTQTNPTSEAYFTTDPIGPADQESPEEAQYQNMTQPTHQNVNEMEDSNNNQSLHHMILNSRSSPKRRGLGSTHSRGSGTADSPIAVEDDLGTTRRLLFPSPRKGGALKVLGELAGNAVNGTTVSQDPKSAAMGKENIGHSTEFQPTRRPNTPVLPDQDELDQELFGSPVDRPSTPPPKSSSSGIFKTPTRPTPNHRPITRSISRSIRTVRSAQKSPGQLFTQTRRIPTKTPRGTRIVSGNNGGILVSASKRRSPRHARFALDDSLHVPTSSPTHDFEAWGSLNQLLSEADQFTANSSSHGLLDVTMQHYDSDSVQQLVEGAGALDFGSFMGTDMIMPSSPPMTRVHHHGDGGNGSMSFEASLSIESLWVETTATGEGGGSVEERNAAADVDELS